MGGNATSSGRVSDWSSGWGKTTQRITYNMALVFPSPATVGQRYPTDPGLAGVTQYEYDGAKWNAVISTVSLGPTNQDAFNAYGWPNTDGTSGYQLTTDGAGNLSWTVAAASTLTLLDDISSQFDGTLTIFGLTVGGTAFTPTPVGNILVFLGGVPQIPGSAYTITGATIQFLGAPLAGTTFYAISSTIL